MPMQSVMEKPSLPSIKYILGDADPLIDQHHRPLAPPQATHSTFHSFRSLYIQGSSFHKKKKKVAGD